jgi:NADPH:quinone reductase-like Zn-dependent oxidoreductase
MGLAPWKAHLLLFDQCYAGAASAWFKHDLGHLFQLLKDGHIERKVAERIVFDQVADAHRRLEAGGLEGKLVLCPT